MTRLYGRAHKSERVVDFVPDVRFKRVSILSTVRLDGTQIPFIFEGTLNKELFKSYNDELLAPSLCAGDIVIMDNSSVHKAKGVIDKILEVGAQVMFLPPYSPDLNPIEMLWSKMKTILRKLKARTSETLLEALNYALNCITKNDIKNWFSHNGYAQ